VRIGLEVGVGHEAVDAHDHDAAGSVRHRTGRTIAQRCAACGDENGNDRKLHAREFTISA
jgi:hypothetical protein